MTACRILLVAIAPFALCSCGAPPDATVEQPSESAESTAAQLALATLPDDELAEGWISLFDGQTLFGWQPYGEADWRVEDGVIVVESGEMSLLCTTTTFDDYVFKVDFRSQPGTNSGIFLRTKPTGNDVTKTCYELNIAPLDNPFPTGSLVQRQKVEGEHESDDWQSYEVTMNGGEVIVQLDGEEILRYTDPNPVRRGPIALQHNQGKVEFRNIKLKPLGLERLFNGENLSGWKEYPEMPSEFSVTTEGWLNVTNGRGQLESEQAFGDFVLQFECISNAEQLNSGVFFRCIPGDEMMGYESQIHNGFVDGDRTRPVDCGTGGIFRRQDARIVAADDLKWFSNTLIADGPHVAVWVNGMQVSDWTDTREAHENPRQGLRVEPGTLMIQGHDPTTNLSFRNLAARELHKRMSNDE